MVGLAGVGREGQERKEEGKRPRQDAQQQGKRDHHRLVVVVRVVEIEPVHVE